MLQSTRACLSCRKHKCIGSKSVRTSSHTRTQHPKGYPARQKGEQYHTPGWPIFQQAVCPHKALYSQGIPSRISSKVESPAIIRLCSVGLVSASERAICGYAAVYKGRSQARRLAAHAALHSLGAVLHAAGPPLLCSVGLQVSIPTSSVEGGLEGCR